MPIFYCHRRVNVKKEKKHVRKKKELRKYQVEAVENVLKHFKQHPKLSLVVQMPTGSGKSLVISDVIRNFVSNGKKVLLLVHVKELIQQNLSSLLEHLGQPQKDIQVICSGLTSNKNEGEDVTIASPQSLLPLMTKNKLHKKYDLIIVDEAHRVSNSPNSVYEKIRKHYLNVSFLGLTATPFRLGLKNLLVSPDIFDCLHKTQTTKDLTEKGFLSPLSYFGGKEPVFKKTDIGSTGDFTVKAQESLIDIKQGVLHLLPFLVSSKKIVIFASSVSAVNQISTLIPACLTLTGKTGRLERFEVIKEFKSRESAIIVNCEVLTTGFDSPDIDLIVLFRATVSKSLYMQMLGRGCRTSPNKIKCRVVDYGANVKRLGYIDEIEANMTSVKRLCPCCSSYVTIIDGQKNHCVSCGICLDCENKDCICSKKEVVDETSTKERNTLLVLTDLDNFDTFDIDFDNGSVCDVEVLGTNAEIVTSRGGAKCLKVTFDVQDKIKKHVIKRGFSQGFSFWFNLEMHNAYKILKDTLKAYRLTDSLKRIGNLPKDREISAAEFYAEMFIDWIQSEPDAIKIVKVKNDDINKENPSGFIKYIQIERKND